MAWRASRKKELLKHVLLLAVLLTAFFPLYLMVVISFKSNDQFAKNRLLPTIRVGDTVVIHNAGGHSYAMGHNYNNRLRSAEYLIARRGALRKIRRAETIEDLFRTTNLK